MADKLFFRKGTVAELQTAGNVAGSICITTDEPGIYYDDGSTKNRIGDLVIFDTWAEAVAAATANTFRNSALYYIKQNSAGESAHILAKYENGSLIALNDTSALSSAIATINSDITAIEGDITTINNNLKSVVGNGDNLTIDGSSVKSLKALTTAVNSMATSETVATLQTKVSALETADTTITADITNLKKADTDNLAAAKAYADGLAENYDAAGAAAAVQANLDTEVARAKAAEKANSDSISTINGSIKDINDQLGSENDTTAGTIYGDIAVNAAAIEANAKAITDGDNVVKAIIGGSYSSGNTVAADITNVKSDVSKNTTDIATNKSGIKTNADAIAALQTAVGEGGSVSAQIQDAIDALNIDQYQTKTQAESDHETLQGNIDDVAGDVATNLASINSVSGRVSTLETDNTANKSNITSLTSRVSSLETDNTANKSDIATLKTNVSDNTEAIATNTANISENAEAIAAVKEDVDAFFAAAEVGDAAIDTLKEIQEYITNDGTAAANLLSKIEANTSLINSTASTLQASDTALENRIAALEKNTITEDGETNLVISTDDAGNTKFSLEWGSF